MNRTKLKVQFTKVVKIKPRLLDIVTIKSGMNKRKSKALKLMFKNLQSIGKNVFTSKVITNKLILI